MRNLKRNEKSFYYALFSNVSASGTDSDGWDTGIPSTNYGTPVQMKASISPASGSASVQQFGTSIDYDNAIITYDMDCPIDENSHLWIGKSITDSYNYIVKKKAVGLNIISYAVKRIP